MQKRMISLMITLFLVAMAAFAQGPTVTLSGGNSAQAFTSSNTFSGTNLTFRCKAKANAVAEETWAISGTLTSIAVSTNVGTVTTTVAHGLRVGNKITVSGVLVGDDLDLNGIYIIQTVGAATTFTIATVDVSDGTYNTAGTQFVSSDPRTSSAIWSIQKFTYDGSNNLTTEMWADGNTSFDNVCDDQATLHYK